MKLMYYAKVSNWNNLNISHTWPVWACHACCTCHVMSLVNKFMKYAQVVIPIDYIVCTVIGCQCWHVISFIARFSSPPCSPTWGTGLLKLNVVKITWAKSNSTCTLALSPLFIYFWSKWKMLKYGSISEKESHLSVSSALHIHWFL